MDNILHGLLNQLRIIGTVRVNQRLCTANNSIDIYANTWLSWIRRKLYNDGKSSTVRYLTDLYHRISLETDKLISQGKHNSQDHLKNLDIELQNSIKGLENLKITYRGYQKTQACIDGIINDYINPTLNTIHKHIPAYVLKSENIILLDNKENLNEKNLNKENLNEGTKIKSPKKITPKEHKEKNTALRNLSEWPSLHHSVNT